MKKKFDDKGHKGFLCLLWLILLPVARVDYAHGLAVLQIVRRRY